MTTAEIVGLVVILVIYILFMMGMNHFKDTYVRNETKRIRLDRIELSEITAYEQQLERLAERVKERYGRAFEREGYELVCDLQRVVVGHDEEFEYRRKAEPE